MTPSWRKPAGALGIVALIFIWCIAIASLTEWIATWHIALQLVFFCVTGLIWILPLKPVLRWMETGRWRLPQG